MIAGRLAQGQGTALSSLVRLGAVRTGRPASSLQCAIHHDFGTNSCFALTQSWTCL